MYSLDVLSATKHLILWVMLIMNNWDMPEGLSYKIEFMITVSWPVTQ